MKYCIVGAQGSVDPKLATLTLFDLLGDPATWTSFEVRFFTYEGEALDKWAEELRSLSNAKVVSDFEGMDGWTVMGPTDEDLVKAAGDAGAQYLALDDGLVELRIVDDESEEIPVVPDVKEEEKEVVEEVKEDTAAVEVPAEPKRKRTPRKRAEKPEPKAEESKPEETEAKVEEYREVTGVVEDTPHTPLTMARADLSVEDALRVLISDHLANATYKELWTMVREISYKKSS